MFSQIDKAFVAPMSAWVGTWIYDWLSGVLPGVFGNELSVALNVLIYSAFVAGATYFWPNKQA